MSDGYSDTSNLGFRPGFVTLHPVIKNVEYGVWCEKCLLPSAVRFDIDLIHDGGVIADAFDGPSVHCPDCGGSDA